MSDFFVPNMPKDCGYCKSPHWMKGNSTGPFSPLGPLGPLKRLEMSLLEQYHGEMGAGQLLVV